MDLDPALVRFCADALNPHKLTDSKGEPVERHMRIVGTDRRTRGAPVLMVDDEGEWLPPEVLANNIMERAGSLLGAGEKLRLELVRKGKSPASDSMDLRLYTPGAERYALTARKPLDVLSVLVGGKEHSLIIADPLAQLASVNAAITMGRDEQNAALSHRMLDRIDALAEDVAHWRARADRAERDLAWHRRTEPVSDAAAASPEEPAWKAFGAMVDALKGPLAEIVGAGSAIARAQLGAGEVGPAAPREVPNNATDTGSDVDMTPEEAGPAVDGLIDSLIPILLQYPALIPARIPKLIPILNAGGKPARAGLRAWLASADAADATS